jgi:hypothetical protein
MLQYKTVIAVPPHQLNSGSIEPNISVIDFFASSPEMDFAFPIH